ncbi:DUF4238 domain-containing protein [Ottowia sp. VDI28]|uniref:DUF4238 domain-containing protein n=1 Tax=Ottowia sp. VDI28 TaxID=3133968 RepID=UPI003C30367D
MAGRKQHFIPQALQRGFGQAKGKKTQVYVFKKGQEPYLSSTEGVAAQRDFYSEPSDEETLDDRITKYEELVLSPAVTALRESPIGPVDANVAAAVIVHLTIRSAFVRGSFSVAATELLDHFVDSMVSDEKARTLLGIDSLKQDSMFVERIEEDILAKFGEMPEHFRNAFGKLVHFRAREKFRQMFPTLAATVLEQLEVLLDKVPGLIVSSHSKALDRDLAPKARVDRLKEMNWRIIAVDAPEHFVLPDCLAIGSPNPHFTGMQPYSLVNDDELAGVVMPISSSKVLVGCTVAPELETSVLNVAFAQCSLEFFISSCVDAQSTHAAAHIGEAVADYMGKLIEGEAFAAPAANASDSAEVSRKMQAPVRVPVKFEPSSRKSGKAQAAVRNLMNVAELHDGLRTVKAVVITDDVARSLRQRGMALNDCGAQMVQLGTCHVTETSHGVSSELFVTTGSVNQVVKGGPLARPAAALILHQAGRATYYAIISERLRGVLSQPRPTLEVIGLRIAHFFCSHYFGMRLSQLGCLSAEEFAATDALYRQALAGNMKGIADARLHFMEHRNVDAALTLALGHLEQMLCATANACACTGEHVRRWRTSQSFKALEEASLGDWFELFALDLERFFESRERMSSDSDLVLLGCHIERLLWSFGIVLAAPTPEQVWMEVLGDEQTENVRVMLRA